MQAKITVSSFKDFVKKSTSILKQDNNVLLKLTGTGIEAIGTNSIANIRVHLDSDADNAYELQGNPTDVLIGAMMLKEAVSKLPDGLLEIEYDKLFRLKSGDVQFKLNCKDVSTAPNLKFSDTIDSEIDYSNLLNVSESVGFAVSKKGARLILTGVHYFVENGIETFEATDSYRLAKLKRNTGSDAQRNVTIPGSALATALSVFKGTDEMIGISYANNKIQFSTSTVSLQYPLLDGNYPNTERLIPKQFVAEFTCDRKELLRAVDRSSLLKEEVTGSVIRFSFVNGENLKVRSKNAEIGEYNDTVYIKDYSGDDIEIKLASLYLTEALKSINDTDVKIQCCGEMKPLIVTGTEKGDDHINLLLQVRTWD